MNYTTNRSREYRTHGIVKTWNDACREIDRRQKNMLRAAGVYKPGSEHHPMPEPGTERERDKVNAYFQRLREQEHARLIKDLTTDQRLTIYGY